MSQVDAGEEFRLYVDELVRFATLLVGADDATDVVSEAVTTSLARGSLVGVENIRAYWFRAVMNTAADWHRKSFSRRRREERFVGLRAPVSEWMPPGDARRILAGLSPQQKAVVFLTYWYDLSPASVGELLAVSEGTVRKQLARARNHLREVLTDE